MSRVQGRNEILHRRKHDENIHNLNPFENLWTIGKAKFRKTDCTTKTKLIEVVIQVLFRDQQISKNCKKTLCFYTKTR